MKKLELLRSLEYYFNNSQSSERFAMYRLITPIIDFANEQLGFQVYFEYNQTSLHKTSQFVDIALLDRNEPALLIEAKRLRRKLSADQINKYLSGNTRGVVTDGENWILCLRGKNRNINLLNQNGKVSEAKFDEIISFIRNEKMNFNSWDKEIKYFISKTKPVSFKKDQKAKRANNKVLLLKSKEELELFIKNSDNIKELEKIFLSTFFNQIDSQKINNIVCESRRTRVSFFDKNSNKRVGRIELGKKNPDILLLTKYVELDNSIEEIVKSSPHDKGAHMRRFRLWDKQKTREFRIKMVDLIKKAEDKY
jgi:hypothetical protein